jgi:hypothetical protein
LGSICHASPANCTVADRTAWLASDRSARIQESRAASSAAPHLRACFARMTWNRDPAPGSTSTLAPHESSTAPLARATRASSSTPPGSPSKYANQARELSRFR